MHILLTTSLDWDCHTRIEILKMITINSFTNLSCTLCLINILINIPEIFSLSLTKRCPILITLANTYRCFISLSNSKTVVNVITSPTVLSSGGSHWVYALAARRHMAQNGQHDFVHETRSDYVLHCRQQKIEPRPHVTCTGNFMKFGPVVLRHASAQTYRHACRQYFARFFGITYLVFGKMHIAVSVRQHQST